MRVQIGTGPSLRRSGQTQDLLYPLGLLTVYASVWTWLAIAPFHRGVWLLENVLVVLVVPVLAFTASRFRFSDVAYTGLFLFLMLHAIGSHFTYSLVPMPGDRWFTRNPFDRVVHFSFGLLVMPVIRDGVFALRTRIGRPGLAVAPAVLGIILGASVLFELVEWGALALVDGDTGAYYLATQGDRYDAVKDVAAAFLGGSVAVAVDGWARRRRSRAPADAVAP